MRNREVQIKFYATEKERESIRRNAKRAEPKTKQDALPRKKQSVAKKRKEENATKNSPTSTTLSVM